MAASSKASSRPGGNIAEQPRADGQDVDLVDGDPVPDPGRQGLDHQLRPGPEAVRGIGPQPEVLAQPGRMGEVVQRDQRLEAALEAAVDDAPRSGSGPPVDRPPVGAPPGPTRRSGGSCCTRARRRGRAPPRAGPRSPRRCPTARPGPTCSQASQLLAGCPGPLKPPSTWKPAVATPKQEPVGQGPAGTGCVDRRWLAARGPRHRLPPLVRLRCRSGTAGPHRPSVPDGDGSLRPERRARCPPTTSDDRHRPTIPSASRWSSPRASPSSATELVTPVDLMERACEAALADVPRPARTGSTGSRWSTS